jgi:integrase/recombinase XerD
MVQSVTWEWLIQGFKIDLETQVKPKTVKDYCNHVSYFSRWVQENQKGDPPSILKRDIQEYLHYIANNPAIFSPGNGTQMTVPRDEKSRWYHYFPLKRFFTWAVNEGFLERNPVDGIILKPPDAALIEPYKPEHIATFFKILDNDWRTATTPRQKMLAARNRAVLSLFLDSFLRLEECSRIGINDIDLERKRLLIRKTKTDKPRVTGFSDQTKKYLWCYLGLRGNDLKHNMLWVSEEGHPLTKHGLQEIIRRLKREAGLQGLRGSVHKLRHTGATITLKHTRDMKGLRLLLGHSTLAMTERYTQFIDAEDALKVYDGEGPLDWIVCGQRKWDNRALEKSGHFKGHAPCPWRSYYNPFSPVMSCS